MMAFIKLLWLSLLIIIDANMFDILRPKTIRIHKLSGTCPGHENAPLSFRNVHLAYSNRIHLISLTVVSTENVPGGLKIKLDLKRCQSREALDSCEKYQTVVVKHLCDLLNGEDKPWTPLVQLSQPPMSCPIKKGVFVVNNGTFDGTPFAHLPVAGWYWIVTANILGETSDRLLMCVVLEGQLVPT